MSKITDLEWTLPLSLTSVHKDSGGIAGPFTQMSRSGNIQLAPISVYIEIGTVATFSQSLCVRDGPRHHVVAFASVKAEIACSEDSKETGMDA